MPTHRFSRERLRFSVFGQETCVIGVELGGGELVEPLVPKNGSDVNFHQPPVLLDRVRGPLRLDGTQPALEQVGYAARVTDGDLSTLYVGDKLRQVLLGLALRADERLVLVLDVAPPRRARRRRAVATCREPSRPSCLASVAQALLLPIVAQLLP